jgi:Tfp pilus assembly protein PilP
MFLIDEEVATTAAAETPAESKLKPAKKAVKKSAPKKKAVKKTAAKKVKVVKVKAIDEILKASSLAEIASVMKKAERKRAIVSVNGKQYTVRSGATWCLNKSLVEKAKDGTIVIIDGKGQYVYPKAEFKSLFEGIFASTTWADLGSYSQSVLPSWHEDYFTKKGK